MCSLFCMTLMSHQGHVTCTQYVISDDLDDPDDPDDSRKTLGPLLDYSGTTLLFFFLVSFCRSVPPEFLRSFFTQPLDIWRTLMVFL